MHFVHSSGHAERPREDSLKTYSSNVRINFISLYLEQISRCSSSWHRIHSLWAEVTGTDFLSASLVTERKK